MLQTDSFDPQGFAFRAKATFRGAIEMIHSKITPRLVVRFFVLCAIALLSHMAAANAVTMSFHTVYYHTVQGSFWAQLADDTGASPTPRQLAIASVNNNFKAIKALGFDTVTLNLPDDDGWPSQHGGGFSYDPASAIATRPQYAIAQEIVVRIAAANDLKVIFEIAPSNYQFSTDDRAAWVGLADQYNSTSNPPGAYNFIQSLINPTLYYGVQNTTKLSTVGIKDGPTRSFIGDTKIIGWQLYAEWNRWVINAQSGICTQQLAFTKYWNYFYNLVHSNGADNAFAGTYLIGSPDGGTAQVQNIKVFKQWFAPGTGVIEPDLIGIEYYGGSTAKGYNLASEYNDLTTMVNAMATADTAGDFAIPTSKIYLGEGNANQQGTPAINQYFQDVMQVMSDDGLAGIQFFVSDTLANATDSSGNPTLTPALPIYDLFATTFASSGVLTYPDDLASGVSWHLNPGAGGSYADPTTYPATQDEFSAAYGKWLYTAPTDIGTWLGEAIATHTNGLDLRFYANPNPVKYSTGMGSTLYWDLSHMPNVKSVQVHTGSPTGPIILKTKVSQNSLSVPVPQAGLQDFYLIDTTTTDHKLLGTVVLEAQ